MSRVHPLARTTPRTRAEIKASSGSLAAVAERYNITVATARKWKGREDAQDRSHRPHKLSTTLSPAQELLAVELRRTLLLPLDDLLAVVREFINPQASRSGLDRCLRRMVCPTSKAFNPSSKARQRQSRPSRTTSPASCTSTSSTCHRCPMRRNGATFSWPSTGPRAGSSCTSTATRPTPAAPTSCAGSKALHRCGSRLS